MGARARVWTKPSKTPAETSEQASDKSRDASFGIVIAVIAATMVWAVLIGTYVYFYR